MRAVILLSAMLLTGAIIKAHNVNVGDSYPFTFLTAVLVIAGVMDIVDFLEKHLGSGK